MIDKSKIIVKEPVYVSDGDGCVAFLLHALVKTSLGVLMLYIFYLIIK